MGSNIFTHTDTRMGIFFLVVAVGISVGLAVSQMGLLSLGIAIAMLVVSLGLLNYKFTYKFLLFSYIFCIPMTGIALNLERYTFGIEPYILVGLLLFVGILLKCLVSTKGFWIPRSPINTALSIFFIIATLSVLMCKFSPYISILGQSPWLKSGKQLLTLITMVLIYYSVIYAVNSYNIFLKSIKVFMLSAFIVSIYALYQAVSITFSLNLPFTQLPEWIANASMAYRFTVVKWGSIARVSSVAAEPTFFANFLVSAIPVSLALLTNKVRLITKSLFVNYLVLLVIISALILTFSRTGYLSAIVGIGIVSYFSSQRFFKKAKNALIIIFILFISIYVFSLFSTYITGEDSFIGGYMQDVLSSTFDIQDKSVEDRARSGLAAWQIFREYPILGVGLGNYGFYYYDYQPENLPKLVPDENWRPTQSLYGGLLAETGLLGFFSFLSILLLTVRQAYATMRDSNDDRLISGIALGLLASFIGTMISYSTIGTFRWPNWWFLMAMIVTLSNLIKRKRILCV